MLSWILSRCFLLFFSGGEAVSLGRDDLNSPFTSSPRLCLMDDSAHSRRLIIALSTDISLSPTTLTGEENHQGWPIISATACPNTPPPPTPHPPLPSEVACRASPPLSLLSLLVQLPGAPMLSATSPRASSQAIGPFATFFFPDKVQNINSVLA